MTRSYQLSRQSFWGDLATAPALILVGLWTVVGLPVLLIPTGVALWTFVEYSVHRWIFHGAGRLATAHARHHHTPVDLIGASPFLAPSLAMAGLMLSALWWPSGSLLLAGVLLSYLWYFALHSGVMHGAMLRPGHPLRRAIDRHARHHHEESGGETADFGITTAFWDSLLGTRGPRG